MRPVGGGAMLEKATREGNALTEALQIAATRCGRLSDEQISSMRRRKRTAATAVATGGVATAVVLAVGAWPARAPVTPAPWTRVLTTRAGERGIATLADGSTIRLNGATRVQLAFSDKRRTARLLAGQAFFDVRHDATRPFIVLAGGSQARVLGTAFDVDLTRRRVALAVHRGAVGFDPVAKPRGMVVRAGYRSVIRDGVAEAPKPFNSILPDWQQGWIDTAGMRLDELVEVLDRQGGIEIATPQGSLASLTITGRFRTDQPRELLKAIGHGFGFSVIETREGLRLQPVD